MKIEKMILRNFSAIKNAMDANEISIDFSQAINKICLLIGRNGSGKTTLLSMMQPFSDLGNLDVRNGNKFVLPDKEGYKEIHIRSDNDLYIIKHFYTPHKDKSHSVKSYIEKNGVELNINGNVTSFKEIIKEELQIEPDFLKLIRLGKNVTSLIELSSTERKTFMSKIMDDIGIFLEYYKSVNNKLRQLNDMISHTVDKLNRLGVSDKKDIKRKIKELNNEVSLAQEDFSKETSKLAILNHALDEIEDRENLKDNLSKITKKYQKMSSIIEKKDLIESYNLQYYDKKISEYEKIILVNETEITNNDILLKNSLSHLNDLEDKIRSIEIQLTKEQNTDKEIEKMNQNLNKIRLKLREYEDNIGDFKPSFSKKDLEDFIVFLKNTQQMLSRTYEFGKLPVSMVTKLLQDKKNVMNYINRHLIDIDETHNDSSSLFLSTIMTRFNMSNNDQIIIDCKEECKAKTLFSQIQTLLQNAEIDDNREDASFYHDMEFVYQNLMAILPNFANYKDIIDNLPKEIQCDFTISSLYNNIGDLKIIYNEKEMNDLLSMVTEYDSYVNLLYEYDKEEKNINKFCGLSNLNYVKDQYTDLGNQIEETRESIFKRKEEIINLKEQNNDAQKSLEVMKEIHETIEKFDEVKYLFNKYSNDYLLYKENSEKARESELQIAKIRITIDSLNNELQNQVSTLNQFESLSKDLEKYNRVYDDMTYIKNALSSKEGIPLHFIAQYLGDTEEITNELLDIAYDGKIYIDKFDISATEFSIPFVNKGVYLSDVKYASQGELSFLTLALSFALSSQAISKYNIMLWDEIDGALDSVNREKFIYIVENQIDRVKSEQNFLITHNNMFSSYPVDIIDLSFNNDNSDYPLANYITVNRK